MRIIGNMALNERLHSTIVRSGNTSLLDLVLWSSPASTPPDTLIFFNRLKTLLRFAYGSLEHVIFVGARNCLRHVDGPYLRYSVPAPSRGSGFCHHDHLIVYIIFDMIWFAKRCTRGINSDVPALQLIN